MICKEGGKHWIVHYTGSQSFNLIVGSQTLGTSIELCLVTPNFNLEKEGREGRVNRTVNHASTQSFITTLTLGTFIQL